MAGCHQPLAASEGLAISLIARLPIRWIAGFGVAMIALNNLFDSDDHYYSFVRLYPGSAEQQSGMSAAVRTRFSCDGRTGRRRLSAK